MTITILTEKELRNCIKLDLEVIDIISDAFAALARGDAVMPPILRLDVHDHNGEMDVKTAYVRGFDSFALKMSSGFFDNPKIGLPSLSGMMTLMSSKTGRVEAVLLDNGYLTDIRTAAAGAVAARHLARKDCKTAGVLGAGTQAGLQIEALRLVRPVRRVLVWARDAEKAGAFAEGMARRLGITVETRPTPETVVRESDVVVTTTPAREPLIQVEWLHPGLHITAMGSDAEDKNEIAPVAVAAVDRLVVDSRSQSLRLGEMHHAVATGAIPEDAPATEIGSIVEGRASGRDGPEEITLADLTGTGVQDTAIALVAARKAAEKGYGTSIEG
jgi:ornithine cyclodeaminase